MKSATILFLFSLLNAYSFSQDGPLTKGQVRVNGGLGLISYIKIAGGRTIFPPLTVSAEYAISENMTVGGIAGYTSTEDVSTYSSTGSKDTYKFSNTLVGVRANYYFSIDPKFEAYSGAFLGYNAVKAKLVSESPYYDYQVDIADNGAGFLYGFQLGGRYRFSSFTSAFAELGYGISVLNIGITLHLGKNN